MTFTQPLIKEELTTKRVEVLDKFANIVSEGHEPISCRILTNSKRHFQLLRKRGSIHKQNASPLPDFLVDIVGLLVTVPKGIVQ